jgi:hypothetical protein
MAVPGSNIALTDIINEFGIVGGSAISGSGSFTSPGGTQWAIIQIWGSGGGGAGSTDIESEVYPGAGGGGGGYSQYAGAFGGFQTINYEIGTGGAGGSFGGFGGDGTSTTVTGAVSLTATGGNGGQFVGGGGSGAGLPGGAGGTGDVNGAKGQDGDLILRTPGDGGGAAISGYFEYDGSIGITTGAGGTGADVDVNNAQAGQDGAIRVIFIGGFANNNLRSYFRSSPTFIGTSITQHVPSFNTGVPTSGNLKITDFANASAQRFASPTPPDGPEDPPEPTFATITVSTSGNVSTNPAGTFQRVVGQATVLEISTNDVPDVSGCGGGTLTQINASTWEYTYTPTEDCTIFVTTLNGGGGNGPLN